MNINMFSTVSTSVGERSFSEPPLYAGFLEVLDALALAVAAFISINCAVWCVSMKDGVAVCAPPATITALQIDRCESGQGLLSDPGHCYT